MIRKTNKNGWFLISGLLFLICSCTSNVVFINSVTMKNNTWSLFDNPEFKVPVTDTINSNNIFFTIRTGSKYPFRNIYLFVTAISPVGKSITDTLQYDLADEKGNWYGKGSGDIHELNLPYKTNVFFPLKGTYHFKIRHGMRIGDLKGIYDFGLRVEKFSK